MGALISGKSRLVKYYNVARCIMVYSPTFITKDQANVSTYTIYIYMHIIVRGNERSTILMVFAHLERDLSIDFTLDIM